MSDSDSVHGEVEYSDDEDYIRNESVMSAHHNKIDGSFEQEEHHHHTHHPQQKKHHHQSTHQKEEPHADNEQSHQQAKHQTDSIQLNSNVGIQVECTTLPTEEAEKPQIAEAKTEKEVDLSNMVSVTASQLLQDSSSQNVAFEESYHNNRQDLTEKIESNVERPKQAVNSQESNDDEDTYRENQMMPPADEKEKQIQVVQQNKEVLLNDVPAIVVPIAQLEQKQEKKQEEQLKVEVIPEAPAPEQPIQPPVQALEKPSIQNSNHNQEEKQQEEIHKEDHLKVRHAEPQPQPQPQPQENPQKDIKQEEIMEVSKSMPSQSEQYTESERNLLAGMNVVAASSNSQFSEAIVQRKLFKTDLQREVEYIPPHDSSQLRSEEQPTAQKDKQLPSQFNPDASSHELMSVQQKKSLRTTRKEEAVPTKSEACKCQIM